MPSPESWQYFVTLYLVVFMCICSVVLFFVTRFSLDHRDKDWLLVPFQTCEHSPITSFFLTTTILSLA